MVDQRIGDMAQQDGAPGEAGAADSALPDAAAADSAPADIATPDMSAPDAMAKDAAAVDAAAGVSIIGKVSRANTATCGPLSTNDCKGQLVVVAFGTSKPPMKSAGLATTIINSANLTGTKTVSYTLTGLKGSTTVHLAGFLVEAGSPSTPPWPASASAMDRAV